MESTDVRIAAAINIDARHPQYAISINDDDPVYEYIMTLTLNGTMTYPPERIGNRFQLVVSGDESASRQVSPTLKEFQERDQYGSLKYREYRGGLLPVYKKVPGLGFVEKVRGEPAWSAWINVKARLVSDMLVLIGSGRLLFLAIDERKEGRTRWIDAVGLQTTDPAED